MAETRLEDFFTTTDWVVVVGYLALCTFIGHRLRGKQATIRDFFLGGRTLPWPAVSGSIIATEISGLTFIGVPAMVFAINGDFTYLQWAIGSILARVVVGIWFTKWYYEREIYSPYDFMENRLGSGIKRLATGLFFLGSILGQSVRVLVASLVLTVVTGVSFTTCIWLIGAFAIVWTLMGGMRTVIWTDVMQFCLFVVAGFLVVFMILRSVGGWEIFVETARAEGGTEDKPAGKFTLWDFTTDPRVTFTFWVAIIAVPFQNLFAFGVDQLNAQRMFCCRSAADARKAMIWSSAGQVVTVLMLMAGAAIYVYFHNQGMGFAVAERVGGDGEVVMPAWITTNIPIGVRGLILAGVFAAAITSLDSILAALSQTTLSLFIKPETLADESAAVHRRFLNWSRGLVLFWGISLSAFAVALNELREGINLVELAFGMIAYTTGPMLGLFIAAVLSRTWRISRGGLVAGVILGVMVTAVVRQDVWKVLINYEVLTVEQVAALPVFDHHVPTTPIVSTPAEAGAKIWQRVFVEGVVAESGALEEDGSGEGVFLEIRGQEGLRFIYRDDAAAEPPAGASFYGRGYVIRDDEGGLAVMLSEGPEFEPAPWKRADDGREVVGEAVLSSRLSFAWMYPVTTLLTLICGLRGRRRRDSGG